MDRDVLITRIIDGRAGDADWALLRAWAGRDGSLLADLAAAQRDAQGLREAMAPVVAAGERSRLPDMVLIGGGGAGAWLGRVVRGVRGGGLGWAVAAALVVAWAGGWLKSPAQGGAMNTAGIVPVNTNADDVLQKYMDLGRQQGRVIAELPERVVIESRPSPDGKGVEVLYLRQLLERATVSDVYKVGLNDAGQRVLVPTSSPAAPGPAL